MWKKEEDWLVLFEMIHSNGNAGLKLKVGRVLAVAVRGRLASVRRTLHQR